MPTYLDPCVATPLNHVFPRSPFQARPLVNLVPVRVMEAGELLPVAQEQLPKR